MRRNIIIAVCAMAVATTVFTGCKHAAPRTARQPGIDAAGQNFYTTVNIWYENPQNIASTNYHAGAILPAGTEVRIQQVDMQGIDFTVVETGRAYRLNHVKRHSEISIEEYFDRHFSKTDPMGEDGRFQEFTEDEQENIKAGTITEGMSKDAVIMAYGYPPTHRTYSLKANRWTYWLNRFLTQEVRFEDDRVSEII